MEQSLGKSDWLRAARLALLHGGVEAVRVERLARDLHVTKGSFYWHFSGPRGIARNSLEGMGAGAIRADHTAIETAKRP